MALNNVLTNVLTTRDIHIAVKKPNGTSYLMERFSFKTEDELFQTIRKVSPMLADDFIKELQKKQKKQQKKKHRVGDETTAQVPEPIKEEADMVEVPMVIEEVEIPSQEETSKPATLGKDVEPTRPIRKSSKVSLEELLNEEQELSAMQCAMEVAHKEEVAKRRAIIEQLLDAKNVLLKIQKMAAEKNQQIVELYQEYQACKCSMHELNREMSACREYLVEIRDKIAVLQKVTIYVYETGVIEGENIDVNVAVSVDRLKAKIDELIAMPESDAVTMGQIKSLARLSLMLEGCTDKTVELVFESSNVQALYEKSVA